MQRSSLVLLFIPLLAACGGASGTSVRSASASAPPPRTASVPATRPQAPVTSGDFRTARVMDMPGLEGVIGADANALQRQFGTARLDVWEGDARKLQFTGEPCVLDVYLYPPARGAEPRATYVDARRASDGLDVDRASCVRALKRGR